MTMRFSFSLLALVGLLLFAPAQSPVQAPLQAKETSHVVLRLLDKVTAGVSLLTLAQGETGRFGKLEIIMHHCDRTPPTEPPESTALLQIGENLNRQGERQIFYGWMFASSPAVNPLQHPVYDVWVLECISS